ncbi:MgtC/SapB family protein [Croceicoccus sediminis]|uniref:MgtC/SapB family protein n=1 Tax=Croceicoccus sediminis TaxID=2571150 RepID=UPI0011820171|nr:MgtC/SapB family protein [Croceicoccus sediminis]
MSAQYPYLDTELVLPLLSALAAGLLIGIERGWRQRELASGSRVAGIRTFTLIGGSGAIVAIVALNISHAVAAVLLAGLLVVLVTMFLRAMNDTRSRDATTMVAALVALGLGLLGGAGYPAFAVAGAALTSFILAMRRQSHAFVARLTREEMQAIARYAVLAVAILPFLPDAQFGPYDAWNPFRLWLVVLLITGFSIAGYVANRLVGERRGTIVTAMIGGAYSSTAVTASLAQRLREGTGGPLSTGIALASAIMYLRVIALTAILAPVVTVPIFLLLGAPTLMAFAATALAWRFETGEEAASGGPRMTNKPFALLPAFVFLAAVAGASLLVNWAQAEFGEAGGGLSLFIAGSFDVDAAIVAFSALPEGAVAPRIAALALAGTVAVNMAFKTGIVLANARWRRGRTAALALLSSLILLLAILIWDFVRLFA